jgi:hypothetical protein
MEYAIAKVLHVLVAVYWLGSDVAVYHISGFMTDRTQTPAIRLFAGKLMLALDMIPRTCLPLMLLTGCYLAATMGLFWHSATSVLVVGVPFTAAWLWLTWTVHHKGPAGAGYARFDFALRVLIILLLVFSIIWSALGKGPFADTNHLLIKLGLFTGVMALGLVIRIQLKPLGGLFQAVASGQATEAQEQAFAQLLSGVKWVVWLLWLLLLAAVWLGVSKLSF